MSRSDDIQHACIACQKLITQQLEAHEELMRATAAGADATRVGVLQDKVRKLQAATEVRFMMAMDALTRRD